MDAAEAMSDPVRRRVIELLATGELTAGQIADHFPQSRPAMSRHLRILREAGVLSYRTEATSRVYRLQPEPLRDLQHWLSQRLDALDTELARGRRARKDDDDADRS